MGKTAPSTKSFTTHLAVYGPALAIAVVGFVLAYQFVGPPPPRTVTIATGSQQGAYFQFGQRYATWLAQHGIELVVRETSGSAENLQLLADDAAGVDLALVQGGTGGGQEGLYSLGSLCYEPLWVFRRDEAGIRLLSDLKDRPVALGSNFSGTRAIAELLARENGVDPEASTVVDVAGDAVIEALRDGRVDAAFFVASPEAPLLQTLIDDPSFALLNMDRADAYTRRHRFLSAVEVPEGMLDLERNIPPAPVRLISPTANLVVREDLHPALVDLVLQAAAAVHGGGGMFEEPGEFPAPRQLVFPLSPEAARYYEYGPPFLQRYLPFWIATLVDRLKVLILPLIVLLIPLFKVVPPTLRWRIRRKIIRWYTEIQALDTALDDDNVAARLAELTEEIDRVEREVTQVHVPLGYADQLYNLRLHIGLVRDKLERRRAAAP